MAVRISEFHVRDLGPIKNIQIELSAFNLIYGKNERGKTYMVEFLLRALFKTSRKLNLRNTSASGKIMVEGLESEIVAFSPSSSKKLEDYWIEAYEGMPLNMEKLLVVKGGELSMVENDPAGINNIVLKNYLSSEAVLETIQRNISLTLQKTAIEDGLIIGPKAGKVKARRGLRKDLETLDSLFDEIDEVFSEGKRTSLNKDLESVTQSIDQMKQAKKYQAFLVSEEISELQKEKGGISRSALNALKETLHGYNLTKNRIEEDERKIDDLVEASNNYDWLRHAIDEYQKRTIGGDLGERKIFAILSWTLIFATVVSLLAILFGLPIEDRAVLVALFSAIGAAVFGFLHNRQKTKLFDKAIDINEIQQISKEYRDRFGKKITNLAAMLALKENLERDYFKKENLEGQVEDEKSKIGPLEVEIKEGLALLGCVGNEEKWSESISGLEAYLHNVENNIQEKLNDLSRLDVNPSVYIKEHPGVTYQKEVLDELENQLSKIQTELDNENIKLNSLKQRMCQETGDEISIEWEELIQNLRNLREEKANEYEHLTAEILAKVIINDELERIWKQEDKKIQETLQTNIISEPLYNITQRYNKVSLKDEQLIISDQYDDFPLAELSTGAKEQVLLALRIGCAAKVLGKDCLFLILDDAFQHADWERRPHLIDDIIRLGKQGWQIICLTMDDHIRDLILEKGSKAFKKRFHFFDLDTIAI